MSNYLQSFIVGSSFPVLFPFFAAVARLPSSIKNYTYEDYTLLAPLYLGLMNVLATYLGERFDLSPRQRYVLVGVISPLIVIAIAYSLRSYNYTQCEWIRYSLMLIVKHFLVFNVIVYSIEKCLNK